MWTWPLDSALRATAAHRALERVTDGTCTQVWAWMTNKCRRRMNQGEWYITLEISQKNGEKKEKREALRRKLLGGSSWETWGVRDSHPQTRSPFPLRHRAVWFCVLSSYLIITLSQTSRRPIRAQLWDHSLQIHCNEFAGPRSHPSLSPVRKTWSYNWRRLWERLLVRWWVQRLVKVGSSSLREVMVASLLYHKGRTAR